MVGARPPGPAADHAGGRGPYCPLGRSRAGRADRPPATRRGGRRPSGTVTLLDRQLDDVYEQLQRLEVRCAAGEDDRLTWVETLKAEIASATREG